MSKNLSLITAAFAIAFAACAADSGGQPTEDPGDAELATKASEVSTPSPSTNDQAPKPGDDVGTNAGCSFVQYCDAPGTDATRCVQQGCSYDAARTECINEGWQICGTPKCPWKLIDLNGVAHELCG
jgi:hypothetical protein